MLERPPLSLNFVVAIPSAQSTDLGLIAWLTSTLLKWVLIVSMFSGGKVRDLGGKMRDPGGEVRDSDEVVSREKEGSAGRSGPSTKKFCDRTAGDGGSDDRTS